MKKIRCFVLSFLLLCLCATAFSQVIKGTYAIKNVVTGMLLRIKDANGKNGTPLVAYTPVDWKCMTWDFKHVEGQTYQLQNLFTGKTFQPTDTALSEGVALRQQPLSTGQVNQMYVFIAVGDGQYQIRLKGTELYVTPSDSKGSINSNIILAKKNEGKLQFWTIYEQHPTQ